MNHTKCELHILKRVNVSNHSAGRMLEDSSGSLPLFFRDARLKEPPRLAADGPPVTGQSRETVGLLSGSSLVVLYHLRTAVRST